MNRYICIHGHFYQPPRENPWLESIELQDSAYPYHDWNCRITAECYVANATSRILNDKNRILDIVNNYSRISFNFGPTLLDWLEKESPEVYEAILTADDESRLRFSGHGSALAQPYNHMILPLANARDKYTQIYWGIQDFMHHFGRSPEGMWLPETAVDLESLDSLSEQEIKFTILAPHQALRVKPIGEEDWIDVIPGSFDTTRAYTLRLPSGRTIGVFFYDSELSHAVAFEGLLTSGDRFAETLLNRFSESGDNPQLVHIATDGETYGHHHPYADKALAFAINLIETRQSAILTNYAEFLEKHPPQDEVQIRESSSWSCVHGIERWRSDCGCCIGAHPGWNQAWRKPLRSSLNWLRDEMAPAYQDKARQYLKDPWKARNDYIHVILDRDRNAVDDFVTRHAAGELESHERTSVLKLLELQRNAMLMFTSCGWFFDEISGIEALQILQYAGRAIQIYGEEFGNSLETEFLTRLEQAKSNVPEHKNGRILYEKFVRPAMVDLKKVGAHYAMSSLFKEYAQQSSIYCYTAIREDSRVDTIGRAKLLTGRMLVSSDITTESEHLCYCVLHLGKHTMTCGILRYENDDIWEPIKGSISDAFSRADFPETLRLMDQHFGSPIYSLQTIFRDEQRKILNMVMQPALIEAENEFRQVYENNATMMRFMKNLNIPVHSSLYRSAEIYLNAGLRKAFENEALDMEHIKNLLNEAGLIGLPLDSKTLEYALRHTLEHLADDFVENPYDLSIMEKLESAVNLLDELPFEVNLITVQNRFNSIMKSVYPKLLSASGQKDENAVQWVDHFVALGKNLSFYMD